MKITDLSAVEISQKIHEREFTIKDVLIAFAANIAENHNKTGSFAGINLQVAMGLAERVQERIDRRESISALAGVPFAVCENIFSSDRISSCGSKMLDGFISPYTATVIERLLSAGAIYLGQINMEEFGFLGYGSDYSGIQLKNPWNNEKTAGSSGAGSALISGMIPLVIGSDNGEGLGLSAAYCGASAMVPTRGAVSRHGMFSAAPSIERIGAAARGIFDISAALQIISGADGKDLKCMNEKISIAAHDISKIKIGVPSEMTVSLPPEIRSRVLSVPECLRQLGAETEVCSLPVFDSCAQILSVISSAESYVNLSRFTGKMHTTASLEGKSQQRIRSERFSYLTKRRIMLGRIALESDSGSISLYEQALKSQQEISKKLNKFLSDYDLIVIPAFDAEPPSLGADIDNPLITMQILKPVSAAVLAGLPSAFIPCGYTPSGLPVGCQIIGRENSEPMIISAALAFQRFTSYHKITANLV